MSKFSKTAKSISDYSDGLFKFISALKIEKTFLIGLSASGLIITDFLRSHSRIIKKVMFVSTSVAPIVVRWKFIRLALGYLHLLIDYLKTPDRIKFDFLWLDDARQYFFRHPVQFILEPISTVKYIPYPITLTIPSLLLFALKDVFFPRELLIDNMKVKSLVIETIDDDHCWFFLKQNEFVEKVRKYFK